MMAAEADNNLDASHLGELVRETHPANLKWYDIGLELGLESFILDGIKVQYSSPGDRYREMLKEWLKGSETTWRRLENALKSPTVRETKIAGLLSRRHSSQSVMTKFRDKSDSNSSDLSYKSVSSISSATSDKDFSDSPAHEAIAIVPYGCGCGICTFSTFLADGCPKPRVTTSSFPFLNKEGLTDNQRQILHGRLTEEYELMCCKFSNFTTTVCDSLTERAVPIKKIVRSLRDLKTFQPSTSDSPLLKERFDELKSAQDIDDIFEVLTDYVSFFCFRIIEHIITQYGAEKEHAALQTYNDHLAEYCRRNIFECPSYCTPKKGQATLALKADTVFETYTMKHLSQLTTRISTLLSLNKHTLNLCSVEKGCVQLAYQLPQSATQVIFPLSREQREEFGKAGFTKLVCGRWMYSFTQQLEGQQYSPRMASLMTNPRDMITKESTLLAMTRQTSTEVISTSAPPPLPPKKRHSLQADASDGSPVAINEALILQRYCWYHGDISRSEAEDRLFGSGGDRFIVRRKGASQYALSEIYRGKMKHYIIDKINGQYNLERKSFHTIPEMVEYLEKDCNFNPCAKTDDRSTPDVQTVHTLASDWIDAGTDYTGDSDWTGTEEWTGTGDSGFGAGGFKVALPSLTSKSVSELSSKRTLAKDGSDKYTSLVKGSLNQQQTYTQLRMKDPSYTDPDDYKPMEQIEKRVASLMKTGLTNSPPPIYDRVRPHYTA